MEQGAMESGTKNISVSGILSIVGWVEPFEFRQGRLRDTHQLRDRIKTVGSSLRSLTHPTNTFVPETEPVPSLEKRGLGRFSAEMTLEIAQRISVPQHYIYRSGRGPAPAIL